jgi:hypothetical protein
MVSPGPVGNLSPVWGRQCGGPAGRAWEQEDTLESEEPAGADTHTSFIDKLNRGRQSAGGADMSCRSGAKRCMTMWDGQRHGVRDRM